jgi:hypothetical protein
LVLRVVGADASAPAVAELADSIFGITGDTFNLASGYNQCSYGQITFQPVQRAQVTSGVYTVTISNTIAGATDATIRTAAVSKAEADLGSSLSSIASHTMMCLPPGTSGGWIAYVSINLSQTIVIMTDDSEFKLLTLPFLD